MDNRLGRQNPGFLSTITRVVVESSAPGTRKGQAGLIRNFRLFCESNEVKPFFRSKDMINPIAALYWFIARTRHLGSCNSMNTWSAALTWLCEIEGLKVIPKPLHQLNTDYALFKKRLAKVYSLPSTKKVPCTIQMIQSYLIKLGVTPGKYSTVRYDNLVNGYLIVLCFLGAYRPSELVYSEFKQKVKGQTFTRIKGLRWKHVSFTPRIAGNRSEIMQILVPYWKTKKDVNAPPLEKQVQSPCCSNTLCKCQLFDILSMHHALESRRRRMVEHSLSEFGGKKTERQRINLGVAPNDFVFVNARGYLLRYDNLRKLMEDIGVVLDLLEKLTAHSLRVGATSLAYLQGIPCLQMCRYVEWSVRSLPIVHALYVKIRKEILANIPFDLLHGALVRGVRTDCSEEEMETMELRAQTIISELYGDTMAIKKDQVQKDQISQPNQLRKTQRVRMNHKLKPRMDLGISYED